MLFNTKRGYELSIHRNMLNKKYIIYIYFFNTYSYTTNRWSCKRYMNNTGRPNATSVDFNKIGFAYFIVSMRNFIKCLGAKLELQSNYPNFPSTQITNLFSPSSRTFEICVNSRESSTKHPVKWNFKKKNFIGLQEQ